MLANKDPAAIIAPLVDRIASITILPVPGHEHHKPEAFAGLLPIPVVVAPDIASALAALSIDPIKDAVLIAGSLYLAGVVLAQNGEVPA
jgi:dihydrofolate synthase/folylpolyglutamate synthase